MQSELTIASIYYEWLARDLFELSEYELPNVRCVRCAVSKATAEHAADQPYNAHSRLSWLLLRALCACVLYCMTI